MTARNLTHLSTADLDALHEALHVELSSAAPMSSERLALWDAVCVLRQDRLAARYADEAAS